jgi:hypothetical protein
LLLTVVNQDLSARYATRFEQYRLPKSQTETQSLALTIGCDGHQLLSARYCSSENVGRNPVLLGRLYWYNLSGQ